MTNSMYKQISGQVYWQISRQVDEQVYGQVWRQVDEQGYGQVWRQIRIQIRDQVEQQLLHQGNRFSQLPPAKARGLRAAEG